MKEQKSVANNCNLLTSFNRSMAVALERAENGSQVEDMYFLEKLEKTAKLLGFELIRTKDIAIDGKVYCESCGRLKPDTRWHEDTQQYECTECYQWYLDHK